MFECFILCQKKKKLKLKQKMCSIKNIEKLFYLLNNKKLNKNHYILFLSVWVVYRNILHQI